MLGFMINSIDYTQSGSALKQLTLKKYEFRALFHSRQSFLQKGKKTKCPEMDSNQLSLDYHPDEMATNPQNQIDLDLNL